MMMMMGSSCAGVLAIKNQARLGWQKSKNNKLNKCSSIRKPERSWTGNPCPSGNIKKKVN